MKLSLGRGNFIYTTCLVAFGIIVGNYVYSQPGGGVPTHLNHECLQDTHCSKVIAVPHPNCPGTHPVCVGLGTDIFWKCIPPAETNCTENVANFGSTVCAGRCAKDLGGGTYEIYLPLTNCFYNLDHCF